MKSIIRLLFTFCVLVGVLSLFGCAGGTMNSPMNEDNISKIVINSTTKAWVQENIGTPTEVINLKKEGVQLWN